MYAYLNHEIVSDETPQILLQDRGLLLADGLFETFKIIDDQPLYLEQHLQRLFSGANILGITHEISLAEITKAIDDLIEMNQWRGQTLSARLTLTRGAGQRGLLPSSDLSSTVLLTLAPYVQPSETPWILSVASNRRNEYSMLSNIKSLAYTEHVFARIEAQKNQADDALFLNTNGFVACTTCANIFLIKNQRLLTPALSDGVLPGITRARVIAESILPVEERSITLQECHTADQIFVTNALIGIKTVSRITL